MWFRRKKLVKLDIKMLATNYAEFLFADELAPEFPELSQIARTAFVDGAVWAEKWINTSNVKD